MNKITYFYEEGDEINAKTVEFATFIKNVLPNFYHRITVHSSQTRLGYLGLPQEFIDYSNPYVVSRINASYFDGTRRCYYILEKLEDDANFYVTMQILKAFNSIHHLKFTMILPDEMINLVRQNANENISLLSFDHDYLKLENPFLVIGQGKIIIEAILAGVTAVVAGKRGLGGLVDDENIRFFTQFGFEGRNGGYLEEQIPFLLMRYHIEEAANKSISLSNETMEFLRSTYLRQSLETYIETKRHEIKNLQDSINKKDGNLRPILCKNIKLNKIKGADTIITNTFNDYLIAEIEEDELKIIQLCNGEKNLDQILENFLEEEHNDVFDFIHHLFVEKIIFFK